MGIMVYSLLWVMDFDHHDHQPYGAIQCELLRGPEECNDLWLKRRTESATVCTQAQHADEDTGASTDVYITS